MVKFDRFSLFQAQLTGVVCVSVFEGGCDYACSCLGGCDFDLSRWEFRHENHQIYTISPTCNE